MTLPVPGWPEFGPNPGSVWTITIWVLMPEIVDQDLSTELDTITAMNDGTVAGGPELLPGSVVQGCPQAGGLLVESAKPLKLFGAPPPLSELLFAHCAPQ